MTRVLHLVRSPAAVRAFPVIEEQARDPACRVSVVLWPGIDWPGPRHAGNLFRLRREDAGPGPTDEIPLDYPEVLRLIFEADTVVTW